MLDNSCIEYVQLRGVTGTPKFCTQNQTKLKAFSEYGWLKHSPFLLIVQVDLRKLHLQGISTHVHAVLSFNKEIRKQH